MEQLLALLLCLHERDELNLCFMWGLLHFFSWVKLIFDRTFCCFGVVSKQVQALWYFRCEYSNMEYARVL